MSEQLLIAGFHRSGTSATAQLLHRAGLFLGYELLEALPSNPYGHFEDREVVFLHQDILADNELSWLVDRPLLPVVTEARWGRMRAIAEKRNFSESTRSLGQRHSSDLFTGSGNQFVHRRFWQEPDLALRMWLAHNRALLAFARAYPEDTLTVSQDMIRDGFPLVWAVNRRWSFSLEDVPVGEVYDPRIIARRSMRQPGSDVGLIGAVRETWEGLERLSAQTEEMLTGKEAAFAGG